jgi:hypothetical protein
MTKSKYQMLDALRAAVDAVLDSRPRPIPNGCHPSFGIWTLTFNFSGVGFAQLQPRTSATVICDHPEAFHAPSPS